VKLLHVRDEQPRRGGSRCADMSLDLIACLGEDLRGMRQLDDRKLGRQPACQPPRSAEVGERHEPVSDVLDDCRTFASFGMRGGVLLPKSVPRYRLVADSLIAVGSLGAVHRSDASFLDKLDA
jgi:hypothetical protein